MCGWFGEREHTWHTVATHTPPYGEVWAARPENVHHLRVTLRCDGAATATFVESQLRGELCGTLRLRYPNGGDVVALGDKVISLFNCGRDGGPTKARDHAELHMRGSHLDVRRCDLEVQVRLKVRSTDYVWTGRRHVPQSRLLSSAHGGSAFVWELSIVGMQPLCSAPFTLAQHRGGCNGNGPSKRKASFHAASPLAKMVCMGRVPVHYRREHDVVAAPLQRIPSEEVVAICEELGSLPPEHCVSGGTMEGSSELHTLNGILNSSIQDDIVGILRHAAERGANEAADEAVQALLQEGFL